MNAELDCEAHNGEQRADTEMTRRGAQVTPEHAPVETQCERQDCSESRHRLRRGSASCS